MRFMFIATLVVMAVFSNTADAQGKKKNEKKAAKFEPVEINNALDGNDPNDPKINQPSKKFTIKLFKDKTYVITMRSKDMDSFLRLLDKAGNELAEDDDSGGDLDAQIVYTAKETGDHQIVAITLDGQLGKFSLKVREFVLQGEAQARDVDGGLKIDGKIALADDTAIGKLGKIYSVKLKAGETYTIDMASNNMDSYLYLFDGKGKKLSEDDDSGGGQDARIVFRAPEDGVYHIIATSFEGMETGDFTLNVKKND